jgi:transposase
VLWQRRSNGKSCGHWPCRRIERARSCCHWTSLYIAEAFSVKPDSVRHWRWTFGREGVSGLRARKAPGPEPVKARAALSVASQVVAGEVADRPNWTLPRLQDEIAARTGERISKSRLSVVMRKKGAFAGGGHGTP